MPLGQKVSPHHWGRITTHFWVRMSTIFGADVHEPKGSRITLYKKKFALFFWPKHTHTHTHTFGCGCPRFLARTSMSQRVLEYFVQAKVCFIFWPLHAISLLRESVKSKRGRQEGGCKADNSNLGQLTSFYFVLRRLATLGNIF